MLKWSHSAVELSVEVTGLTLLAVSKDEETARALWDFWLSCCDFASILFQSWNKLQDFFQVSSLRRDGEPFVLNFPLAAVEPAAQEATQLPSLEILKTYLEKFMADFEWRNYEPLWFTPAKIPMHPWNLQGKSHLGLHQGFEQHPVAWDSP